MAVHAEAFAGGTEQGQQHDGEGVEQQQPVASLRGWRCAGLRGPCRSADPWYRGSSAPWPSVSSSGRSSSESGLAARSPRDTRAPSCPWHGRTRPRRLDTAPRWYLGIAQLTRPPAWPDPLGGAPAFPLCGSHGDIAAKADDVGEPQRRQEGKQLLSAKPRSARMVTSVPAGSTSANRERQRSSYSLRRSLSSALSTLNHNNGVARP